MVALPEYSFISDYRNGMLIAYDEVWLVSGTDGKILTKFENGQTICSFDENYIKVLTSDGYTFFDYKMNSFGSCWEYASDYSE